MNIAKKNVVEAETLLITSFLFAGNSFLLNGKATSSQATSHTPCFQSTILLYQAQKDNFQDFYFALMSPEKI